MSEPELTNIRGVVLDLDGTVYDAHGLIPGAAMAIDSLRHAGFPLCFATNTTRRPRAALAEQLHTMGLDVDTADLLTAPMAAVAWLRAHGARSVALHLAEPTVVEFEEFERDERSPDVVVVGDLGDGWTFARLNQAFRQLMTGARLLAVQRNRYWRTDDGLTLDAGPFVAALEYAVGTEAVVVGKPAPAFFDAAARLLDLPHPEILVVGDDVTSDVGGAIDAGLRGVLVRTGKFQVDDLNRGVQPDLVIESIAELPVSLGLSRTG